MQIGFVEGFASHEEVPQLVAELQNIADRFSHFSDARLRSAQPLVADIDPAKRSLSFLQATKMLIEDRTRRDFGVCASLFADPAWDILLALFAAELESRQISITCASTAAKVPMTTALRYIAKMERDGLIERRPAQFDKRSSIITLTRPTYVDLFEYVSSVAENWGIELSCLVHRDLQ